ncbi:hypothetical protein MIR68_005739 [Amoeboaphelidium protococcarum]|nr:hypothetical protein MIR68_005739 [Amoeboaphelidium protococcarum]
MVTTQSKTDNNNAQPIGECPMSAGKERKQSNAAVCPVRHDNMMPDLPQSPAPDQETKLDTSRQISSIPRASKDGPNDSGNAVEESNWVYPSDQQFYNALHRKGKPTDERDVSMIVSIHNEINERTWKEIERWESMHCKECPTGPRLLRFSGKPNQLSPRAWFYYNLGLAPRPFDRHDWIIDRCGREVRYVIDYYEGDSTEPAQSGNEDEAVMHVDVRPAVDSITACIDRLKMLFQ